MFVIDLCELFAGNLVNLRDFLTFLHELSQSIVFKYLCVVPIFIVILKTLSNIESLQFCKTAAIFVHSVYQLPV